MNITVTTDDKEKYQSCEAVLSLSLGDAMSHCTCDVTAYGATKEEAITNLKSIVENVINDLSLVEDWEET